MALRAELGLSPATTLMSFGLQVANYRQLRDAVAFLQAHGRDASATCRRSSPPASTTRAFAIDPDGHALQLYYYMEQIGWDGKPRPAALRPKVDNAQLARDRAGGERQLHGEVYLGPWS